MKSIGICYFRSLFSQSACSLSVGKFSHFLLNRGYNTNLYLLEKNNYVELINNIDSILKNDMIIYKTNYKDFEYGIRLFENIIKKSNKPFYLIGPFSIMNKNSIKEKYSFITDVIDIQDNNIEKIFDIIGPRISKETIISGVDRELEFKEKGRYINVEASTGCIYNCAFCHINLIGYRKSTKEITLLINEIEELYYRLGKRYFIFNDSVFWKNNDDNERIELFVKLLKQKNIRINFMIYLSLTNKIDNELLEKLKSVGLIRVFFGVENISKDFMTLNHKYTSKDDTINFIKILNNLNISYHIGFILLSRETKFDDIKENIDFLYQIRKLFRPGILVEKMRILPSSTSSQYLYYDNSKIDQAYNYHMIDSKVEEYYTVINDLFKNINIRNFEQFFSGINLSLAILKDRNINIYDYEKKYNKTLDIINNGVYEILINELNKLVVSSSDVEKLMDLYSIAENNYFDYMNYLKNENQKVYEMIPHGQERMNVW